MVAGNWYGGCGTLHRSALPVGRAACCHTERPRSIVSCRHEIKIHAIHTGHQILHAMAISAASRLPHLVLGSQFLIEAVLETIAVDNVEVVQFHVQQVVGC